MNDLLFATEDTSSESGGGFLPYLPAILWQRRWWIIIPFIVGIAASVAAAVLIPPRYEANAIMLVQPAQVPDQVAGGLDNSLIERRIAGIKQQVTSRPDLIELINRHGLYANERTSKPLSDVIDKMRDNIALTPTTVKLPTSGADDRTVAFNLTFDYSEAAPAQAVVQDLMDRILDLDANGNLEQATNTAQFLSDQAQNIQDQISKVQAQLADVNARYGRILGSAGTVITGGTGSYDVQIAELQRDNSNLIAQKEAAESSDTRDPVVKNAEAALAAARAIYSEDHPDVVIAKQRLKEARELAKSNSQKLPLNTIDQQIAFNNSQIAQLRAAKSRDEAQISSQLAAQARAPEVQQQVSALQQKLSGLNQQYQDVQKNLLAAKAGVRAEDEQMGERLAVVQPPVIPDTPIWPNRMLILAIGAAGSLALGMVLAGAVELLRRPIRDPRILSAITGAPPIGIVPIIPKRPFSDSKTRFRLWPRLAKRGLT